MSKVILDAELQSKLDLETGPAELCDANGKPIGVALSGEEYKRLLYDRAWAEFSTPEAMAEQKLAEEQFVRGEYTSSEELFAELREKGFMPPSSAARNGQ